MSGKKGESTQDINKSTQDLQDEIKAMRSEMKAMKRVLAGHEKISSNLKENRELFDTLTSNMLDGLVIIDWDGSFLFANKAAYRIVGLKPRRSPKGFNMVQFLHPEDLQKALEIQRLAKAGTAGSLTQYRIITHKHDQKWIEAICRRISFGGQDASMISLRDITEKKYAEERLNLSEKKFSAAFRSSPDYLVISELKSGRIIDVNKGFETWSGYSRDELIGHTASELDIWANPSDRTRVLQEIKKSKGVSGLEIQVRIKGGQIKDVLFSASLIEVEARTYLLSHALDITDRKKMESALKESEERFRQVFDKSGDGILIISLDNYSILQVNKALCDMLGYTEEELRKLKLTDITPLDEQTIQKEQLREHAQGKVEQIEFEKSYITKNGSTVWGYMTGSLVRDASGKPLYGLGVIKNTTKRKQAEEELQESEEKFRLAFENANTGMCLIDLEGHLLKVNAQMGEIFGYSTVELESMTVNDIAHPDDMDKSPAFIQRILSGEIQGGSFEKRYFHKRGHVVHALVTSSLIRDSHGSPLYFISQVQDITDRKRAEAARKESEERYRKIAAAITDYIYKVHVEAGRGVSTEHSPACEAVTGYTLEEFNSDRFLWLNMVVEEDRERVRNYFNKVLIGEHERSIEHRIYHKDGSIRWVVNMPVVQRDETGAIISYDGVLSDITKRKQAEEAIRQRQAKLDSIFRAAPTGIGVVTNRILQEVNERICVMTGYSREELVGKPARILYPTQEDHDYVGSEKYRQISEKGTGTVETHWKQKDDTIIDILLSSTPIVPGDLSAGVTFTALDITDRKQAEEALRESEERYRLMAELTGKLVYDYDVPTGRITWHGAISRITGFSPEEFGAVDIKAFNEMIHPEDRTEVVIILETALKESGTYNAEYRLRGKDGSNIFVEDHGVFLSDRMGRAIRMLGSLGDISLRKQAEEAIREAEKRYRTLFESANDAIFIMSEDRFIECNQMTLKMFGCDSKDDIYGRRPWEFSPIEQPDGRASTEKAQEVINAAFDETPQHFYWKHVRKDGTPFDAEVSLNRIELGDQPYLQALVRDITERKKAEEQKLDMERRLLHAQKLESLGVMAGGIAHDFNNLLMAILGNLDLARLDLSPVSRSRPFIDQALKAGRRAADLTNQMLAYSGKGRFDLKPFDLSELVQEMAHLLKASISKTVTLNLQIEGNLPSIVADPSQIQQIIMNLIVNASEAVGQHPGVVTITTGALECDQDYLQDSRLKEKPNPGTYVFIEVMDTGCGMDDETKGRLFDPFFTTKFTGRGLGMAAVLGIVSGHKGAIIVESDPGKGTAIRVMFPASQGKRTLKGINSGVSAVGLENVATAPASGMVLIADDEDMVRDLCRSMVERLGYKVITAKDGEEAVKIFHKHATEIICVILDLTMPKLDGLAAYDELRRIKPDVRVIISSGYDEQETTDRFAGKGLAGFIKKPYQLSSLGTELTRALKDL